MKILIGSDHAGFEYKNIFLKFLQEENYETVDLGAFQKNPDDDYPDYAAKVAKALLNNEGDRGILICGSAVGISIAANKFRGIRAGVCHDTYSAHQCVEHDNVNILCLGERIIGIELAKDIVTVFLKAEFSNASRHVKRLEKIAVLEDKNFKEKTI